MRIYSDSFWCNAIDAERGGFVEHQRVTLQGDSGKLEQVEIIYGSVREGAALMFYPEVNVIFKARIDPRSGTSMSSELRSLCIQKPSMKTNE